MQRRILLPGALVLVILISLINWGCSKLDTTDIGTDLIPAVDNVNTFADTLDIITTQGFFNDSTDVSRTSDHVLGSITNDPLFGQTTANIYMQLKPTFYPYYYGGPLDTIVGFDSVVLCLNYKGFWGDSTQPINLDVRTVNQNNGIWDSLYTSKDINFAPTTGASIGNKNIDVRTLNNYVTYANRRDSVKSQIRIKLTNGFDNLLYTRDTSLSGPNNAFRKDSLFRLFNNGIAVIASNGHGLMYCNLADTNTKIEVHFRKRSKNIIDTIYSSLKLNTSPFYPSATANNIIRNRAGSPSASPGSNDLYLQTTPGSYVNLKIPELSTLSNRIIHRAELIMEQVPDNPIFDKVYTAPSFVYVDLKDTGSVQRWKPIYYDLSPNSFYNPDANVAFSTYFPLTGIDFFYYGGYRREGVDKFGTPNIYYNINISRYVQHIVTNHTYNYDLRLYAPAYLYYPQVQEAGYITYNNAMAKGRVKLGSGTNPNYKMKLRIIYSNL